MCRMSKLYNTHEDLANDFRDFLKVSCPFLSKPCLNIFPDILTSMIHSTSCITKNIALSCKGSKFDFLQHESIDRRIRRFYNNSNYDPYLIYDSIIKHVISKFVCKHGDNRIHIVFDHMFKKEDFVTFMISLRIGKKSIPLWFRSFPDGHESSEAFKESLLIEGIQYVSDLFNDKPNYKLIFLADRWFNSPSLLEFIDSLGHTYVIRVRSGHHVYYFDEKEGHEIKSRIDNLFHYKYKATYYNDIRYTKRRLKTNLVFSPTRSVSISNKTEDGQVDEPWILLTNDDVKRAIKDYAYRFGAIEFLFKDEKSNGFNLEKSNVRNIHAFSMMYTCVNICILFLSCVGTYYTRHKGKYYSDVRIRYFSIVKGKRKRRMSIFQVGLTLFKRAYNSLKYIRIPFNFVITDV